MNGHFTFNFQLSLLQTVFQRLGNIFIVGYTAIAIYRIFCCIDVTSRDVPKRTVKTVIRRIVRLRGRIDVALNSVLRCYELFEALKNRNTHMF